MSESEETEFTMPAEDPIFAHARLECPADTEHLGMYMNHPILQYH